MVKFPCGSLSPARRLAPTYLPPVSPAWPRRTALSFASPARKQTSCWGRTVVAKRWTVFAPQQSSHNLNIWCRRFLPGNPRRASPCDRGPLTGSLFLQCCRFWTRRGSVAGHWPRWISSTVNIAARSNRRQRHFNAGASILCRAPWPQPARD